MGRMSAKYVGRELFTNVKEVYRIWNDMGIVRKDEFNDWVLTELGKTLGGRMSKHNTHPVPSFDFDVIKKLMEDHLKVNG